MPDTPRAAAAMAPPTRDWLHALQLAAAVPIAYLSSAALHLPEGFWAVMSALIVLRPTTGSTLGVGWDRLRGTLAGTALGLVGVWLHHALGLAAPLVTLGIVAALAAGSALRPGLRSAPISALIVLGAGAIPGHSPLQVAGLRAVEIAIGTATGLLLSVLARRSRAHARFDAACAALLRQMAAPLHRELATGAPPTAEQKERDGEALRPALRELAVLAASADREQHLLRRGRRAPGDASSPARLSHVARARLMARIPHDVGLFARLAAAADGPAARNAHGAPMAAPANAWQPLTQAVAQLLEDTAERLAQGAALDTALLHDFGRRARAAAPQAAWVPPTARLLAQDLGALAGVFRP